MNRIYCLTVIVKEKLMLRLYFFIFFMLERASWKERERETQINKY